MASCNPDQIKAALFEEAANVTDFVRESLAEDDRIALRMVPDGGTVDRHDNNDTIIYGEARQASKQYNTLDHAERPLVAGEMKGRDLAGSNGIFQSNINDIDDNACHGQCTIDFSQGFRRRTTVDYELAVDTPIKCVRELQRLGKEHILGYFRGFKNQFTKWGMDNFSDNLMNLIILNSEANASVLGPNQFNVTSGGWQAPPQYRISIHFLQDYKRHIRAEMYGRGMKVSEDWMLEVEMPEEDWMDAVKADQVARNPTGTVYNTEVFKDDEGPMRGRKFSVYGGIKCYFNESPIRGYFQQTGASSYNFVRVYEWKNNVDEEGGIVSGVNHDYYKDTIRVDGVDYEMVTLLPHIDPRSFKRYGLMKPIKTEGSENVGVNYQVVVRDGPYLDCNDYDDKFKLAARHEFRFKSMYPEFSGFIAYRSARRPGYVIDVVQRDYIDGPNTPAGPQIFDPCNDESGCGDAECAKCGQVADVDGDCVGAIPNSLLALEPCAVLESSFLGNAYTLRVRVTRTGDPGKACDVTYATAAGTATEGVDYTETNGTLNWDAGDSSDKYIDIPILATFAEAVPGTPDTITLTISAPTDADLGCASTTISIEDLTD